MVVPTAARRKGETCKVLDGVVSQLSARTYPMPRTVRMTLAPDRCLSLRRKA
jgi:hypothetical protein